MLAVYENVIEGLSWGYKGLSELYRGFGEVQGLRV